MNGRRVGAAAVAAVTTISILAGPGANAAQQWSRLGVSRDGTVWMSNMKLPLFDRHIRMVPGDVQQRTFYVRNQSGQRGHLSVGVRVDGPNAWFASRKVRMDVLLDGAWTPVTRTDGQRMRRWVVPAGDVVPVTVRVRMVRTSGKHTMNQRLAFTVNLRLSQLIHGG